MARQGGFVMADTLIALAILSVLLLSIMTLAANGASMSSKAKSRLTATLIAKGLVTSDDAERSGTFIRDGQSYAWIKAVNPVPTSSRALLRETRIQVTVSWQGANQPQSITVNMTRIGGLDDA